MITCEQLSADEIVGRLCPTIPKTIHDPTKFTVIKDRATARRRQLGMQPQRYGRTDKTILDYRAKLRACGITISPTV